jgi:hypothetical protein
MNSKVKGSVKTGMLTNVERLVIDLSNKKNATSDLKKELGLEKSIASLKLLRRV